MRKTVIVASVFVVASVAMPSMAQAKDKPEPPFGSHSHIGKCKGHVVKPEVKRKGHTEKEADTSTKSDPGLNGRHFDPGMNGKHFNGPGLNNDSLISGVIIRCR